MEIAIKGKRLDQIDTKWENQDEIKVDDSKISPKTKKQ